MSIYAHGRVFPVHTALPIEKKRKRKRKKGTCKLQRKRFMCCKLVEQSPFILWPRILFMCAFFFIFFLNMIYNHELLNYCNLIIPLHLIIDKSYIVLRTVFFIYLWRWDAHFRRSNRFRVIFYITFTTQWGYFI